jgi:hypothetical protein
VPNRLERVTARSHLLGMRPDKHAEWDEAKGVRFFGDTLDTGVCHMAIFADPDGNQLMLHHRYAPYPDA